MVGYHNLLTVNIKDVIVEIVLLKPHQNTFRAHRVKLGPTKLFLDQSVRQAPKDSQVIY